jgi:hypothetical protein
MRFDSLAILALVLLPACGGSPSTPDASAPDAPAMPDASLAAMLVGEWAEPAPYMAFMRLDADGTQRVARSQADLDSAPLATGTWELSGQRLTLTNTVGACSAVEAQRVGVYDVEVTASTLTFTLVSDVCTERRVIGGETWARVP